MLVAVGTDLPEIVFHVPGEEITPRMKKGTVYFLERTKQKSQSQSRNVKKEKVYFCLNLKIDQISKTRLM